MANAWKAMLEALTSLNVPVEPNGAAAVVSSKGYRTTINKVAVGRVPDTMRSRRADLIEDRQSVNVF